MGFSMARTKIDAEFLETQRARLGVSITEYARRLGVDKRQLHFVKRGQVRVSPRIARLAWLIEKTEDGWAWLDEVPERG